LQSTYVKKTGNSRVIKSVFWVNIAVLIAIRFTQLKLE
jgi:hypothetical protein